MTFSRSIAALARRAPTFAAFAIAASLAVGMVPPITADSGSGKDEGNDDLVEDRYRDDQAIVRLNQGCTVEDLANDDVVVLGTIENRNIFLLSLSESEREDELIEELEDDNLGAIAWAELNFGQQAPEGRPRRFFVSGQPPKKQSARSYAPTLLGIAAAQACADGSGIIVAVIDTGIDASHPAFAGRLTDQGTWRNFLGEQSGPDVTDVRDIGDRRDNDKDGLRDEMRGHGTHVAGIVLQAAPDAKILPIKALNSDGIGDAFYLAEAIYYAVDQGAQVINLSLGSVDEPRVVAEAIDEALGQGVIVTAAAGNTGQATPEYPASHIGVLSVAATNANDQKSDFSNYGATVRISAPGTKIVSAFPGGGRRAWSGTSMAAPWVAGTAALLLSDGQSASAALVAIEGTAFDLGTTNPVKYTGQLGAGRVDAEAAAC